MLSRTAPNKFSFVFSNNSAPALSPGTSVTPGASNAEGSATQIASGANIAQDVYEVYLWVYAGATSGQQKDHLLDIMVDPAGGSSYSALISNIACGESFGTIGTGHFFKFPIFIKAGSSVAVRVQGNNGTAGTVTVVMTFFGQPSRPTAIYVGQYSETIGTITNSAGVGFTPGNSGAEGSWQSLGTTTRPLWWWQLAVQISNAAMAARGYTFDLAYGDGSNKVMIIENLYFRTTAQEEITSVGLILGGFCEVPAGGELFVRGSCSGTTDTGWNAVAVGIGG